MACACRYAQWHVFTFVINIWTPPRDFFMCFSNVFIIIITIATNVRDTCRFSRFFFPPVVFIARRTYDAQLPSASVPFFSLVLSCKIVVSQRDSIVRVVRCKTKLHTFRRASYCFAHKQIAIRVPTSAVRVYALSLMKITRTPHTRRRYVTIRLTGPTDFDHRPMIVPSGRRLQVFWYRRY